MRKISKTLVATMIIVATVATFLVGCKKEQIPEAIETRQDKTTLDRIMDFNVKNGRYPFSENGDIRSLLSVQN